tara:strand:- start:796 stop:1896 length:1101 start_codon:yes stop_codon:yes gene_type:complete
MKTLILHVGMHKTGSTSIQRSLEGFDRGLIRYLDLGSSNHSGPVRTIFSERSNDYPAHRRSGKSRHAIAQMASHHRAQMIRELSLPRQRFIISGEGISALSPAGVRALAQFLKQYVDRIQVIGYVRDPVGYANSAFQQRVKDGQAAISVPRPNYRNRFRKFFDVFGRENVELIQFNPSAFENRSVVRDFCNRAGIPADNVREKRANESLSDLAIRLILQINQQAAARGQSFGLLAERDQWGRDIAEAFPGDAYRLPEHLILQELDQADISWLAEAAHVDFGLAMEKTHASITAEQVGRRLDEFSESERASLKAFLEHRGIQVEATQPVPEMIACLLASASSAGRSLSGATTLSVAERFRRRLRRWL